MAFAQWCALPQASDQRDTARDLERNPTTVTAPTRGGRQPDRFRQQRAYKGAYAPNCKWNIADSEKSVQTSSKRAQQRCKRTEFMQFQHAGRGQMR